LDPFEVRGVQEIGVPSGNVSFSELGAEVLLLFKRISVLGVCQGAEFVAIAHVRVLGTSFLEYKFAVVVKAHHGYSMSTSLFVRIMGGRQLCWAPGLVGNLQSGNPADHLSLLLHIVVIFFFMFFMSLPI
jgi:hypothetical protein